MPKTNFEMVGDFFEKFDLPTYSAATKPHAIRDEDFQFRFQHILEEMTELIQGHRTGDVVEVADAIADIVYLAYGLGHMHSIPVDAVFAEVHRSNMLKVRSDGTGARKSKIDIVKPDGWKPPNVKRVLEG